MANILTHSPADIIRWLLIGLGEGTNPTAAGAWPIFVRTMPDLPDLAIVVVNTAGTDHARDQHAPGLNVLHGFQVLIRHAMTPADWTKADAIRLALANVDKRTVAIEGHTYTVNAIPLIGQVLEFDESPTSKRVFCSVNGQASLVQAA